jgi:hypothetical protein
MHTRHTDGPTRVWWFGRMYLPKSSAYAHFDLGRLLYRHVHSLHHRSYNTGPWSGIAMHPVVRVSLCPQRLTLPDVARI